MSIVHGAHTHRTGQGWLTNWTPEKVATAPDPVLAYAEYTQQTLGVPWPTNQDLRILRRKIIEIFDRHPNADYYTLCRVAGWCRSRRKRFQRVWMVVQCFRDAYAAGVLPELDCERSDEHVEIGIAYALEHETDPAWRRRLIAAQGIHARADALADWRARGRT